MNVHHFDKKIGNIEQSQRSFQKIPEVRQIMDSESWKFQFGRIGQIRN